MVIEGTEEGEVRVYAIKAYCGRIDTGPIILNLWSGYLEAPAALPQKKIPRLQLNTRLVKSQSERRNLLPLLGFEHRTSQPVPQSLYRLHKSCCYLMHER